MSGAGKRNAFDVARVYDETGSAKRVLTDRVWPRGVKKEDAELDFWAKALAPSTELRKWFQHEERKWEDFQKRYRSELDEAAETEDGSEALEDIRSLAEKGDVALLTATKDREHCHPIVLKAWLEEQLG